jgi:tripartite-type tricarboxylate transporter receptor subunit TctC
MVLFKKSLTRGLSTYICGVILLLACQISVADNLYPQKAIKLLLPYPPGGSTDIFARLISEKLGQLWGQPVVVENKPGAGGLIAMEALVAAPADGYTILLGHFGTLAINPALIKNLPYDPIKDIEAIGQIAIVPNVLVIRNDLPFKTLSEMLDYAKKNPGKLTYSSGGAGGAAHVSIEYLKFLTGVNIAHIPYKGTGPAVVDLLGGHVDMTMPGTPAVLQYIQSGKLIPLGVSSLQRIDVLPNVPTISESNVAELKNFDVTQWYGVVGKAGTPKAIIAKLNEGLRLAFDNNDSRMKLKKEGAIVSLNTPEAFSSYIKSEINRWNKIVKDTGMNAK